MGLAGFGRIGALALLAATLAGCAAGSPSIVAPEVGNDAAQPVATVMPDPNAPTPSPVPLSDAPTSVSIVAPALTPQPQVASAPPDAVGGAAESTSVESTDEAATGADGEPNGRVAFSQGANGASASLMADPEAVAEGVGQLAPALSAPQSTAEASDRAPVSAAQSGARPPAPSPPTDGMSLLVEGGSNGRPEVALTFDAGADTGYAPAILDLLRDEGIPATFGMTGQWAENNPDLIQRMVAEGHQLINHTWTHQSMTGVNGGLPPMTYEQLADELARTEQIVRDLTGYELAPYYRPPYGDYSAETLGWLAELGYPFTIMWTCDSQGWKGWDASQIFEYCTQVPLEDEVILMHVGAGAAGDYEALPLLVDYYRQQGHAFVTVEQMLQP
ncbi:MAG TPA: polysaccharide deacetylase family protein [Thermomicrobiales bacterium]|nr:polysaccharide deacetylase family protein [Thermomicrobiales bacterium]